MSQNKLAKLRNSDVFKAVMRVLEEYRIPKEDFDVLDRRPHPVMTVRYCGVERTMSLPSTHKTRGKAPVAYSAELRRLLKNMQMAALGAPPEDEIMSQQSNFQFDDARAPIVFAKANGVFTNSRDVAAYFEKNHRDVTRAIDTLIAQEPSLGVRNFAQGSYTIAETGNQQHRCFEMDRDGFTLLAMGFTGSRAIKWKLRYIEAFNAMEAELRNSAPPVSLNDPAWLRGQLLSYTEKVMELQATVAEQAPKVEALERIAQADGSLCITDAAKNLQMPPQKLFKWLDTNGWTYTRVGTSTRLAYQSKIAAGHLEHKVTTKPGDNGTERVFTQVRVTAKGLAHLATIFPRIAEAVS